MFAAPCRAISSLYSTQSRFCEMENHIQLTTSRDSQRNSAFLAHRRDARAACDKSAVAWRRCTTDSYRCCSSRRPLRCRLFFKVKRALVTLPTLRISRLSSRRRSRKRRCGRFADARRTLNKLPPVRGKSTATRKFPLQRRGASNTEGCRCRRQQTVLRFTQRQEQCDMRYASLPAPRRTAAGHFTDNQRKMMYWWAAMSSQRPQPTQYGVQCRWRAL